MSLPIYQNKITVTSMFVYLFVIYIEPLLSGLVKIIPFTAFNQGNISSISKKNAKNKVKITAPNQRKKKKKRVVGKTQAKLGCDPHQLYWPELTSKPVFNASNSFFYSKLKPRD
jgi:hypothetical protein